MYRKFGELFGGVNGLILGGGNFNFEGLVCVAGAGEGTCDGGLLRW